MHDSASLRSDPLPGPRLFGRSAQPPDSGSSITGSIVMNVFDRHSPPSWPRGRFFYKTVECRNPDPPPFTVRAFFSCAVGDAWNEEWTIIEPPCNL